MDSFTALPASRLCTKFQTEAERAYNDVVARRPFGETCQAASQV